MFVNCNMTLAARVSLQDLATQPAFDIFFSKLNIFACMTKVVSGDSVLNEGNNSRVKKSPRNCFLLNLLEILQDYG